jgi:hypothetical protein
MLSDIIVQAYIYIYVLTDDILISIMADIPFIIKPTSCFVSVSTYKYNYIHIHISLKQINQKNI